LILQSRVCETLYPTDFDAQWAKDFIGYLLGTIQDSGVNLDPIPNPDGDCGYP
jgi:hypothetical protein